MGEALPGRPERVVPAAVETEANGEILSANERGPSLVGSLGSSCRYKRLLSCLGCSGQPSIKIFFLYRTKFEFVCPHHPATWASSRAGPPVFECVSPFRKLSQLTPLS
jgi:hypothetical protein